MSMLRSGDILIFKAGNDWVGKSIAWLTKSDVSHAAMAYQLDKIVEMGASGISVSNVITESGDAAYLMRLCPEADPQPLIHAADMYINTKTRYDFPALVILAGLLIYREIRPTPKLATLVDLILRAACKALDKLIQSLILHNPDKAMVCSQLVYQIYRDCGKNYEIELEGGILQADMDGSPAAGSIRMIDMLSQAPQNLPFISGPEDGGEENPEVLARQLYEAMEEQNGADGAGTELADIAPLLYRAGKFLELLEELLKKSKSEIPIDALFVTPGDLLNHAKNLHLIQKITVRRVNVD